MTERIVPVWDRVKKTSRVAKLRVDADRCAAVTAVGTQCTRGLWSGEAGGFYEIHGQQIPLCTVHLRKARAENW